MSVTYFPGQTSQQPNVATPSGERQAMQEHLTLIADVREGLDAMRRKPSIYLPQYENETPGEWARRVASAPWRGEFNDALESLTSRPFAKPVTLDANASANMKALADDIDGRGNNLHVFAREAFRETLASGVHCILIDRTSETFRTQADEKAAAAAGKRLSPYWLQLPVNRIISCFVEQRGGREIITHLRFHECHVERDGYGEKVFNRVRVIEPGRWELWQQPGRDGNYVQIDGGPIEVAGKPTTEVHAVLLFAGQRTGTIAVKPPLKDLADLQVELFRALSRRDIILEFSANPMLSTKLRKPDNGETVSVGPRVVLYGDGTTDEPWSYVSTDAAGIREVRESVGDVVKDFRALALAPTVQRSGDVSATESAITGAKAHSQLQSWALSLKDALEQGFVFSAQWLNETESPSVNVFTDFSVGSENIEQARVLADAQKRGAISKKTERIELKRRSILREEFDPDKEDEQIASEQEGLEPEEPIDPRGGNVVQFEGEAA